jgi:hypothetical protein
VVHISPTRTWELNSQTNRVLHGARSDCLWHCYHHLSVMQPSAQCLTPWLWWTRALFDVLECYSPRQWGCLGLDFEGAYSLFECRMYALNGWLIMISSSCNILVMPPGMITRLHFSHQNWVFTFSVVWLVSYLKPRSITGLTVLRWSKPYRFKSVIN